MKKIFYCYFHTLTILCIVFIPFSFYLFPWQIQITDLLFGDPIGMVVKKIFHTEITDTSVYSDSTSLFALLIILILLSFLLTIAIIKFFAKPEKYFSIIRTISIFYLSTILIKYGADKIFMDQFPSPEPNLLYTRFGDMSKDILYWSTTGTSKFYNLSMGIIEIISGLMLLIRKTRLPGLLISTGILLNIVIINFGFDISVKVFSIFLLLLTLLLLESYFAYLIQALFNRPAVDLTKTPEIQPIIKNHSVRITTYFLLLGLISLEVFYPKLKSGVYDKQFTRQHYYDGGYKVFEAKSSDSILPQSAHPIKNIFIHPDGYIIFEYPDDQMYDFRLVIDFENQKLFATDYNEQTRSLFFYYDKKDSILTMEYPGDTSMIWLRAKSINYENMPALRDEFHWTADGEW
ncbi:MAG: hypothetical protein ACHQFW_10725 [Chitinophagales bacterium]